MVLEVRTANQIFKELGMPYPQTKLPTRPNAYSEKIRAGGRNNALASIGGSLRRQGLSQVAIDTMLQAANLDKCEPPLSPDEVSGIAQSMNRYPPEVTRCSNDDTFNYADFSCQPTPRQWLWRDWFPLGTLIALFSPGGHGKSLLAQVIATHIASGISLFGAEIQQGPVIGYLCEDDNDELLRRQEKINTALGLSGAPPGLYLEGRAGKQSTLCVYVEKRQEELTGLYDRIEEECERKSPVLVIIDNIAQVYGGQENDRHEVTVFCNALTGLARKFDCCVLLLGHTSKAKDSEWSGSTAWEAAVRTRLWLDRGDNGLLTLHRRKANYSGLDAITLEWRDGYLHALQGGDISAMAFELAKRLILLALEKYTRQQIATSHSSQARNYLPKLMIKDQRNGSIPENVIRLTLKEMVDEGELLVLQDLGWKTPSRHPAKGLAIPATVDPEPHG